jgi:hypothetical protein
MTHQITMDSVESSQIEAIGYDAGTQTLAIQFKGKGEKLGSVYHYANFTADDWQAFREAESVGSWFYRNVKPNKEKYPYTRIEDQTEQA